MKTKNLFLFFLVVLAISWATYSPKDDPNSFEHKRPRVANIIRFARWVGLVFLFGSEPPGQPESIDDQPLYSSAPPAIASHEGTESLLDHSAGW